MSLNVLPAKPFADQIGDVCGYSDKFEDPSAFVEAIEDMENSELVGDLFRAVLRAGRRAAAAAQMPKAHAHHALNA